MSRDAKTTGTPVKVVEKKSVCQEAHEVIFGQRETDYGSPEESFTRIATFWSAIVGTEVTPEQVGLMMICLKVSRATQGFQRDSLIDIAGYAGCIERVQDAKAAKKARGRE